jgi:hypothetical protein
MPHGHQITWRTILLGGLLLLYPFAAVLLYSISGLSAARPYAPLAELTLQTVAGESGGFQLRLSNRAGAPLTICEVMVQALDGETTVWTESFDRVYFAERAVIADGGESAVAIEVPEPARRAGMNLLVTVEVDSAASGRHEFLQVEGGTDR